MSRAMIYRLWHFSLTVRLIIWSSSAATPTPSSKFAGTHLYTWVKASKELSEKGLGPVSRKPRKAKAKFRTWRFSELFYSHIFNMKQLWRGSFSYKKFQAYTLLRFLDTDERKMALRARKVSGAFEKRAPGLELGQLDPESSALTIRSPPNVNWARGQSIVSRLSYVKQESQSNRERNSTKQKENILPKHFAHR